MAVEHLVSGVAGSFTVPLNKFGPPGTPGQLHFVAQLPGDTRSDADRLGDTSERRFEVFGLLSKSPLPADRIFADFTEKDGSSYLVVPATTAHVRVDTPWGPFSIKQNSEGELALIEFACSATGFGAARQNFLRAVLPFLDHAAYAIGAPVVIASLRIEDQTNNCITLLYTNPFRKQIVGSAEKLFNEMAPVYAMYREALNSHSEFYRFLCYYKILEGLLGPLRTNAMKLAKAQGRKIRAQRAVVPKVAELPPEQGMYVAQPIKKFFDDVLRPRYRNAVAHFMTDEGGVLHVGQPEHIDEYAGVLLLCELCAREVIASHEQLLRDMAGSP
jgi:hypothetical protein